jgi:iron-sulfur cluster assembly protein
MQITEKAQEKIKLFLAEEPSTKFFRVSVTTGGCSGFSYKTEITEKNHDDLTFPANDKIIVDPLSSQMLESTILDYVDSLAHSGFTFTNSDATSTCGCGLSFDL